MATEASLFSVDVSLQQQKYMCDSVERSVILAHVPLLRLSGIICHGRSARLGWAVIQSGFYFVRWLVPSRYTLFVDVMLELI